LFTVPAGGFLDNPNLPDEAVGFNDTLVTFGKSVAGNNELESSRFVSAVNSNQSLNVQASFNDNNASGVIVDDGTVIPYAIGRSTLGNIEGQAATRANGTASVVFTYPINALGKPVIIWAQGTRPDGAVIQTVADVVSAVFPGIAPAVLSVRPNAIRGNSTVQVTLCLTDVLNNPVSGAGIDFQVDGDFNASIVPAPLITGNDGCVDAQVTTSGVDPEAQNQQIDFFSGTAVAELDVLPQGLAFMTASPSVITLTTTSRTITVSVFDDAGGPISGVQIEASCADPVVIGAANVTGANGQTVFNIALDSIPEENTSSTCEFTAISGGQELSTSVLVIIPGVPPVDTSPAP
jgi:hypothetical protein